MKKTILLLAGLFALIISNAQDDPGNFKALELIGKNSTAIGLSEQDLRNVIVKNSYFNKQAGTRMVYLQQSHLGLPVYNQIQVLSFKNGLPVSVSGEMNRKVPVLAGTSIESTVPAEAAVITALQSKNLSGIKQLDGKLSGNKIDFGNLGVCSETVTAELMWLPLKEGKEVYLVWDIRVVPLGTPDYFMIRVDAKRNRVIDENNFTVYCNWDAPEGHNCEEHAQQEKTIFNQTSPEAPEGPLSPNLVNNASYLVIPYPAESPRHNGGTPAVVNNPWSLSPGNATSLRWHNDGTTDYSITRGNNVFSQEDRDNDNATFGSAALSPSTPDPLTFNFPPDFTQTPTTTANQQFSLTNLFYWNNIIHDISYLHGFDEVSGNFQQSNQGRGGQGNDPVIADCQDAGGTNNANFATPADGNRPRMQMYLWSGTPQKDGSLDNGVVTHEYTHGISNRLTGGPSSSGCLTNAEQMGEGWSDYFGLMYTQDWANSNLNTGFSTPRAVGTYAAGQSPTGQGIRSLRYCTNMAVNNKVFVSSLPSSQHSRGEIWCAALWDMTWNIINQTGIINPTLFNSNPLGGNSIALRLVIEGMRLQPCNPGFIDGRDAILKADSILYGGIYACAIREAFRKRGMGAKATQGSSDNTGDQTPDYSSKIDMKLTQGGVTAVPEGQIINYNINVFAECQALSNYSVKATLPDNVTYVSGGTYDGGSRTVSFTVSQLSGAEGNYPFAVRVNNGTYFPTTIPLSDSVINNGLPAGWSTNATQSTEIWTVSNLRSKSAPYSFYARNFTDSADQRLVSPSFALPAGTSPRLSFWHRYSTEDGWDGGTVEVSTNNGASWSDLEAFMTENGYNGSIGSTQTNVLQGRFSFTGTINDFIRTTIDLSALAGTNPRLRWRFASDNNTIGPSSPAGWFVDDIRVEVAPIVKMRATLFNSSNASVGTSDTVTYILQAATCINASISTQPSSQNVCGGNNAVFSVSAQGTSNSYQWQVSTDGGNNYADLQGDTLTTLTINNVSTSFNNYRYRVVISNPCPSSVTSEAAVLAVSAPASISVQPQAQTICEGGILSLGVTASGGITGYQWQESINGGANFSDIAGANSSAYSLTTTTANNGNIFRVQIGSCSNLVSASALINVLELPSITADPQSVTVCAGNNHTFNVSAVGSGITYQWQISTDGGVNFSDIPGAISSGYSVPAVNSSVDGNQYRAIVSGTCPSPETSAAATLTVGAALNISSQPDNVIICSGNEAILSIGATGAISYQWQVSTNGGTSFTNLPGENSAILILLNISSSQQGNIYRVVLNGCSGNINSNQATLTVINQANISSQPGNNSVCTGSNTSIIVGATGSSLTYQWQVSTDGGNTYSNISGANSATLNLNAVNLSFDNNRYLVVITPEDPCTSVTSLPALLTVFPLPVVSGSASPNDTICAGSQLTLIGSGASSYSWNPSGTNNAPFTPPVSGAYTVTGTDANGCTGTATVQITLNPVPSVSITASPRTSLLPGDSTILTATANPPSSTFAWFRNNTPVAGATTNTITVRSSDVGSYKAVATNDLGCSATSNIIDVRDSIKTNVFIYPNPNPGQFNVRLPSGNSGGSYVVTVYDSKGARVYAQTKAFANQEASFDLRKLASGIYFIAVRDTRGNEIKTGKVAIIR